MARPTKKSSVSKGLGDTVEKVIKATGLNALAPDDCGCTQRKEWLNRKFPYVMNKKGTMNAEQREQLALYIERATGTLTPDDQDLIHSMYNSVFQVNTKRCTSCGAAEWLSMINKLKRVYQNE